LIQNRRPWLIDHGAALYHHHDWSRVNAARTVAPFARTGDHVLLTTAGDVGEADDRIADRLAAGTFASVLDAVPDELLDRHDRERYVDWLELRYRERAAWVDGVRQARAEAESTTPTRRLYRR
jgi:hypothetical protein